MDKKWVVLVVIILIILSLLPLFPVKKPIQAQIQVPYSVCENVPYQVEEKKEVPVNYKILKNYVHGVGIFDWEIEYICEIENVDERGGTFTVTANFYDGGRLAYTATDMKYIGPGQIATFKIQSKGLSYSTDWTKRYKVSPNISPPTKIETHIVTKYKKECRTEYRTEYRTQYITKYVNLLQLISGR